MEKRVEVIVTLKSTTHLLLSISPNDSKGRDPFALSEQKKMGVDMLLLYNNQKPAFDLICVNC